jgi:hypothetical protein
VQVEFSRVRIATTDWKGSRAMFDPASFGRTVEYAMEAISMAGTVLAILSKEGVVMVAEKVSFVSTSTSISSLLNLSIALHLPPNRKSPASYLTSRSLAQEEKAWRLGLEVEPRRFSC